MIETGITKQKILTLLTQSPHGKLSEYIPVGQQAAREEGEFYARLISWNALNGSIRDAAVALPVVQLSVQPNHFAENSLAHLASLEPRRFLQAVKFSKEVKLPGLGMTMRRLVEQYLRLREKDWQKYERQVLQHRESVKSLYSMLHLKPSWTMNAVLNHRNLDDKSQNSLPAAASLFRAVYELRDMSPMEAAGTILNRKIPALIAMGALGSKAKDPAVALALIDRMSATELVTNTKLLQAMGVKSNPIVKAAYENALLRAGGSKKNTLKTTRAIEATEDEGIKAKLRAVQEKQIQAVSTVNGNWLILCDKSGSMSTCIEAGRQIAATMAKLVKGDVYLIFFDTTPRFMKVSGRSYDEILAETRHITANGGTSIGCGMRYAIDAKLDLDGIVVVSDGGENSPPAFATEYKRYEQITGKNPALYFYKLESMERDAFSINCKTCDVEMQAFDLGRTVDFYSLPNLAATMRVSRYALLDQVMATPLISLSDVLGEESAREVIRAEKAVHA